MTLHHHRIYPASGRIIFLFTAKLDFLDTRRRNSPVPVVKSGEYRITASQISAHQTYHAVVTRFECMLGEHDFVEEKSHISLSEDCPTSGISPSLSRPASTSVVTSDFCLPDTPLSVQAYAALPSPVRQSYLSALLSRSSRSDLEFVSIIMSKLMAQDYLSALPPELALHILNFIDNHQTLLRLGRVSRHWHALVQDDWIWKKLYDAYEFCLEDNENDKRQCCPPNASCRCLIRVSYRNFISCGIHSIIQNMYVIVFKFPLRVALQSH